MKTKLALSLAAAGAVAAGIAAFRRQIVDLFLGLAPAACTYPVGARLNIPIPMGDGAELKSDHYFPKTSERLPSILVRSYYGRGYDINPFWGVVIGETCRQIARRGYHVIVQTTRGRFDSDGADVPFVHEVEDGHDTIAWIERQPWSNGAVGMWGQSYLGYVQWAAAVHPQGTPALKAIMPAAIGSQLSSIMFPDGAFGLDTFLIWLFRQYSGNRAESRQDADMRRSVNILKLRSFLQPAFLALPLQEVDVAAFGSPVGYFRDWMAHPSRSDPYWKQVDLEDRIGRVDIPVLLTSGWYDLMLRDLLADYARLRAAGRRPYLTIGPWPHTGVGLGIATFNEGMVWFDAQLKGQRSRLRQKPVRIYVMGANQWREMDEWPLHGPATWLYLQEEGLLSMETPPSDSPPDAYCYDPADPTPALGGNMILPPNRVDNRPLETRRDVVVYSTAPLAQDLEVMGAPRLQLYVHSNLEHTDFYGRLCDVTPAGHSYNVTDGLIRLEPGQKEDELPGGIRKVELDLWPTANLFRRGHRLRLIVASGAHPRWSRNPGTGEPPATATRLAAAEQVIFHDADHPSALII